MGKLVLFDCDGVLINTEEIGYHILSDMLAEHDVSYMRVIGFVGEAHREDGEAEMLLNAGAQMIALNPEQVRQHIADLSGKALTFPFYGVD